jgi:hypothetical protein
VEVVEILLHPIGVHHAEWPVALKTSLSLFHTAIELLKVLFVTQVKREGDTGVDLTDLNLAGLSAVIRQPILLLDLDLILLLHR